MLGKISKWYSEVFLYKGTLGLGIIARIAMFVSVMVNVYMVVIRKLLPALGVTMGSNLVGGYEMTQVAMVFLSSCALCYAWYTNGHIRIGILRDNLRERPRAILDTVNAFVGMIWLIIVVLSVYSYLIASHYIETRAKTALMEIPIWPFMVIYSVVMAHGVLVLLRSTIGLASKAMGKKFAREPYLQGQ